VGITARVLKDLKHSQSPTARVILGAAVIDDVLGLVILAVVGGVIAAADRGAGLSYADLVVILLKSLVFLFGSLSLGGLLTPRLFRASARLRGSGVLLITGLVFCFILSYLAHLVGLAPIVGAYAAGLILEPAIYEPFTERGEQQLEELVQPISAFLVPVFFVMMGMHVELASFGRLEVLGLAAILCIAAIVGKQACSLVAFGPGLHRLSIGLGMVPRGEVGLIFANIGLGLSVKGARIIDEGTFSAVVIMVIVTTMLTPPALKWSLTRHAGRHETAGGQVLTGFRQDDPSPHDRQPTTPS
jgi:Kef-type K+ transport system membrane component KefB